MSPSTSWSMLGTRNTRASVFVVFSVMAWASMSGAAAVPACRFDDTANEVVRATLQRSITAYAAAGVPFSFAAIRVNPRVTTDADTLDVYVVRNAAADAVDAAGCPTNSHAVGGKLDGISVMGGCVVSSFARVEIRCAAGAIRIFSDIGTQEGVANPALVYVLAHELAHVHQRRAGEFGERVERISLQADTASKLAQLRAGCAPALTDREAQADALALRVLSQLASQPPYRQPIFSERGSMYWTIDQLALAADAWDHADAERAVDPDSKIHSAFVATEFPVPLGTAAKNARRFVCDALTATHGTIAFPVRPSTHPPMPHRLRHVAETLEPLAQRLPESGGSEDFAPVARLQNGLAPIFAMMHRENGAYVSALYDEICTLVNGTNPSAGCAPVVRRH